MIIESCQVLQQNVNFNEQNGDLYVILGHLHSILKIVSEARICILVTEIINAYITFTL